MVKFPPLKEGQTEFTEEQMEADLHGSEATLRSAVGQQSEGVMVPQNVTSTILDDTSSRHEATDSRCVPFPTADEIMKHLKLSDVPGKEEDFKVLLPILKLAEEARTTSELSKIIGRLLLPACVWIGYRARCRELREAAIKKLNQLSRQAGGNSPEIKNRIETIRKQLDALTSSPTPNGPINNRDPDYWRRVGELPVTPSLRKIGGCAEFLFRHLDPARDILAELSALPLDRRMELILQTQWGC
ncbi:hypothetical protein TTRE_0000608601 [Trichuris trichiura]|uniref:Uncharacterized protein n=1 Tax=Trichuris trichiura TaxID=36087 RepID=A0A077ZGP6_TRITR|nr:hypothetical protein TTRE_0000608601 [Trichuris trichiura]